MNSILLIGNSGIKHHGIDGQTAKVRLYLKKIKDEGFDVNYVDLEDFKRKPFSILRKIKIGIIKCDRIILISAKRGCRFLIPYINKVNKKHKKAFVLPLVGTSVLHRSIDKLTDKQKEDFILNRDFDICPIDKHMKKQLEKIDYILPETDLITIVFKGYYKLNNVYTLNNFRDVAPIIKKDHKVKGGILKIVFLSRVMREKGIFDLIDVINELNNKYNIHLDIYGQTILDDKERIVFNNSLNDKVKYCGIVDFKNVIQTISNYDLFVFPTRFVGEGTPGVIAESFLAGTPILTSNFPQAKYLMKDGYDSISYRMFDKEDLKNKLLSLLSNKDLLFVLRDGAKKSGNRFSYEFERGLFLKYVCGKE